MMPMEMSHKLSYWGPCSEAGVPNVSGIQAATMAKKETIKAMPKSSIHRPWRSLSSGVGIAVSSFRMADDIS